MEKKFNLENKEIPQKLSINKSKFLNKLFWVKPDSQEIVQVRDLGLGIIRKIGDEIVSNGRNIKPKGTKGIIKGFQEDTCYIKVEWENGDISCMKDGDLMLIDEEKLSLIRKGLEVFDSAFNLAKEHGNKKLVNRILGFKNELKNKDVDKDDLAYTIEECIKFIEKYKKQ